MSRINRWFDVPSLATAPFLAINLSNATPKTCIKNAELYKNRQTGDWVLNKALYGNFLVGQTVVLYYRVDRSHARIYTGSCLRLRKNGKAKDGRPRYRFTVKDNWSLNGETEVPFHRFFEGFTMSSNPTVVWASPACYTMPEADLSAIGDADPSSARDESVVDPIDDPDDDVNTGVLGTETMAEVALREHQRIFASRVTRVWDNRCALTGLASPRLLHA